MKTLRHNTEQQQNNRSEVDQVRILFYIIRRKKKEKKKKKENNGSVFPLRTPHLSSPTPPTHFCSPSDKLPLQVGGEADMGGRGEGGGGYRDALGLHLGRRHAAVKCRWQCVARANASPADDAHFCA